MAGRVSLGPGRGKSQTMLDRCSEDAWTPIEEWEATPAMSQAPAHRAWWGRREMLSPGEFMRVRVFFIVKTSHRADCVKDPPGDQLASLSMHCCSASTAKAPS